jgi:uncharacterized membrane protein (DUF4010 family)
VFYGLFYYRKLALDQPGSVQIIAGLIVYSFGPMSQLMPLWFLVLVFVVLIFTVSAKPLTHRIYEHMDHQEIVTLAKFLLLAAVILPLLPSQPVIPFLPASPFAIWVAVVAVSAISYLGYLLQRYAAPRGGYLIAGLLGGLYSSTATTVVLARKGRDSEADAKSIAAAMVAASGMMYLRLLVLIGLLNPAFLQPAFIPFTLLGIGAIAGSILPMKNGISKAAGTKAAQSQNPLELGTALLFAALFTGMLLLNKVIIHYFGTTGLQLLSFGVGFTDIDPFVLSLLKGGYQGVSMDQLASAIFIAVGSNNFLKAIYAATLGGWHRCRNAVIALSILGAATLGYGLAAF